MEQAPVKNNNSYPEDITFEPKQMEHQQAMAKEDHAFQLKLQQNQHEHEARMKNKEMGFMGFIFGTADNSSKNIAALICLVLIIGSIVFSCIIYKCGSNNTFIETIWQISMPVVTLSLGYIFGKKE